MEDRILNAQEIYTIVSIAKQDVIEEKEDELGLYLKILFQLFSTFKDSDYIKELISYFQAYYLIFLEETSFEHIVYDKIINYFDNIDDDETLDNYKNMEMLRFFTGLINYFDYSAEKRLIAVAQMTNYYEVLIEGEYIDGTNYIFPLYNREHILSEEDRKKVLEQIK